MLIRLCLPILFALFASGANAQQKGNPSIPCFQSLAGDPRFAPIRDKVSLGGDMEELRRHARIGERPNAQEAAALAIWKTERETCNRLEAPYYATRDAGIRELAREHFAATQAALAELQRGKTTYGEYARRRIELYEAVTSRIEQVRKSILPEKPIRRAPEKQGPG